MIEIEDLHKSFGAQKVLDGVDLSVPERTTCAILGRSGAGKTVLLKHVVGLLRPDRGIVRVDGEDVAALSPAGLERMRRKLGILFQGGALFDSLTVFENVAFPLSERARIPSRMVEEKVRRVLARLGLAGVERRYPGELSGGMCKRVAFARAVVHEPDILLYDEPTAGLDPITIDYVIEVIRIGRQELGKTSLLVTHDLPTAFRLADQVVLLHQGRMVEHGSPGVFLRSCHPAVLDFLHGWREQGDALREPAAPGP